MKKLCRAFVALNATVLLSVSALTAAAEEPKPEKIVVTAYGGQWAESVKKNYNAIKSEIESRLKPLSNDYGTKERELDSVKIKIVKSKNIEWDDDRLAGLWQQIESDGADPSAYIKKKIEYTVSENAYKEWSQDLKDIFDDARTEKEAKFKFEFMEE